MDVENSGKGVLLMPRPRSKDTPRSRSKEDAELGTRVRTIRKERGLSQQNFARKMGMNQQTISRYEQGLIRIPAAELIRMAAVLRASLKEFANGKAPIEPPKNGRRVRTVIEKLEILPPKKQQQVVEYIEFISNSSQRAA